MKAYATLFRMELLAWLRVPLNLFFIVAWPVLWLVMMTLVIPGVERGMAGDDLLFFFPSCMALVCLSAMTSLSIRIAIKKEAGVLRRLKAVPFPTGAYLAVQFACSVAMSLLGLACIGLVAVAMRMHPRGSLLAAGILFLLECFVFSVLGFLVAGVSRRIATANIVSMLVMFFMMFLSDMFIPVSDPESIVFRIGRWLPAQPFLAATRGILLSGARLGDYVPQIAVMAAWGVFGLVVSLLTFRFDSK
ncbi:MAG: ABC transporter permease [Spirochaetales bacterium]|nr:ABC transporter permease [Spirochaetales bacterium]